MSLRILFLNLLGTDIYNDHRDALLQEQVNPDTELVIRNLEGVPKTPFLPSPALFYNQYFHAVIDAEKEGFDCVATSCCADPGLKDAKELVNIPVVGPFEAAVRAVPSTGGRLSIISPLLNSGGGELENMPDSVNWARERAREYGVLEYVASVRSAPAEHPSNEDAVRLFQNNPDLLRQIVLDNMGASIQNFGLEQARLAVVEDEANVLFFSCAFWGGMLQSVAKSVPAVVLDPLFTVLKYAEYAGSLAKFH
jgi:Asp/Glu/hydantoin racemase